MPKSTDFGSKTIFGWKSWFRDPKSILTIFIFRDFGHFYSGKLSKRGPKISRSTNFGKSRIEMLQKGVQKLGIDGGNPLIPKFDDPLFGRFYSWFPENGGSRILAYRHRIWNTSEFRICDPPKSIDFASKTIFHFFSEKNVFWTDVGWERSKIVTFWKFVPLISCHFSFARMFRWRRFY